MNSNLFSWIPQGPDPEYDQRSGVYISGRVLSITLSTDSNGNVSMFIGTDGGGVWRSDDFWKSKPRWYPLTDSLPLRLAYKKNNFFSVSSIAVDPQNSNVIYFGTGNGILKTTDGGNIEWEISNDTLSNAIFGATKILVDPRKIPFNFDKLTSSSKNIYACCGDYCLFHSGDGGKTWTRCKVIPDNLDGTLYHFAATDIELQVSNDGNNIAIYAGILDVEDGSKTGIYASSDEGKSWNSMQINLVNYRTGKNNDPIHLIKLAKDDSNPKSNIFAAIDGYPLNNQFSPPSLINIFALGNNQIWNPIAGDIPKYIDTQRGQNLALGVSPSGALYLGSSGEQGSAFFQSVNGGQNWVDISKGINGISPYYDNHAIAFFGDTVYYGNDFGIWRFTPLPNNKPGSGTWKSLSSKGLGTILAYQASSHPTNQDVFLSASQDIGIGLRQKLGIWTAVKTTDAFYIRFSSNPKSNSAYSSMGGILRSDDSGKTWNEVDFGKQDLSYPNIVAIASDPYGTGRFMIGSSEHIYQMIDDKNDQPVIFARSQYGIPQTTPSGYNSPIMAYSSNKDVLYIAFAQTKQIFKTDNGTANPPSIVWYEITNRQNFQYPIASIFSEPNDPDTIYVATQFLIWKGKWNNQKYDWTDITSNLGVPGDYGWIAKFVLEYAFGSLLVGTEIGVFFLDQSHGKWEPFGSGLPGNQVRDLQFNRHTNILTAATFGRGVFVLYTIRPKIEVVMKEPRPLEPGDPPPFPNEMDTAMYGILVGFNALEKASLVTDKKERANLQKDAIKLMKLALKDIETNFQRTHGH